MTWVLVVDDKEMMRDSVATTLTRKGHSVAVAPSGSVALQKLTDRQFDVVVTDLQMPNMDGLELLEEIRKLDEQLPVVFMTAFGTIETAVGAMKQGAFDFITKPFNGDELVVTVERAAKFASLQKENQILRANSNEGRAPTATRTHEMIGSGPVLSQLRQRLAMIADSHGTVFINGESGSGKEVAARWIHEHSPRATMPFMAINCAALSSSLLESELFGHEKGAFTGADKLRKGRFELADGGTLLLDEISEVSPNIQAKLLRILQERTFERVGSSASRAVDVRVIATSNRSIEREVAEGRFREDLFFRLNVLPLMMPPLREHTEDIAELASHFLALVAEREGKPVKRFTSEAVELLRQYRWPGNIRELQNICERAAVLTPGELLEAGLIRPWLGTTIARRPESAGKPDVMVEVTHPPVGEPASLGCICNGETTLEEVERQTIVATLRYNNGHRQKSAKALGIGVRTLGLKLKRWKEQKLVSESL